MTDATSSNRLRVSSDAVAGPFLRVPLSQLDTVQAVLDQHGIRYWADSFGISLNGKPAVIIVNFGKMGDAECIQRALDEVE